MSLFLLLGEGVLEEAERGKGMFFSRDKKEFDQCEILLLLLVLLLLSLSVEPDQEEDRRCATWLADRLTMGMGVASDEDVVYVAAVGIVDVVPFVSAVLVRVAGDLALVAVAVDENRAGIGTE